ncbi:MAG: pyridoxine 5'-phosphate synthase [bacterium]
MIRLSLHLNPLVALRRIGGEDAVDLLRGAVAADLAGVDGIACRLDEHGFVTVRDVATVRSAIDAHLTVEVESFEGAVLHALEVKPDQVTFVPPVEVEDGAGLDVSAYATELRESVRTLHASGVEASVLVAPNISLLKEVRRLEFDYVTLNSTRLARASTPAEAIEAFEEFETAALGASRLGLRVLAQGSLDARNAGLLAGLGTVEEVFLDHRLYARAFLIGLDRAIAEVREATHRQGVRGI